jgi:hypothetical protein
MAWSYYAQSISTFQNFDKNSCLSMEETSRAVNVTATHGDAISSRVISGRLCRIAKLYGGPSRYGLPKPPALTFDVSVQCFENA